MTEEVKSTDAATAADIANLNAAMPPTAAAKTLEMLTQEIAVAAASGDTSALETAIKEYNSRKAERAKVEAAAALAEANALAGVREKLAIELHGACLKINELKKKLGDVKATGFTFKLDTDDVAYKSVALAVPVLKVAKATGGNGGAGKTKDEYGMTLDEVYQKFAGDEDKVKMAAATTNTQQWAVKTAVKKAALAANLLAPAK